MSAVDFHALTDKQLSVLLAFQRVNTEMRSIRGPEQLDAVANRIGVSVRSLKTVLKALQDKDVAYIQDDRVKLSGAAQKFAKKVMKESEAEPATEKLAQVTDIKPKRVTSHANCTHPKTRAARAQCRKERAEAAAKRGKGNGNGNKAA